MRNLLIILLAILFASCNPLITKELRDKNKCNRKVNRELKRHKKKVAKIAITCPAILSQDTIRDTVSVEVPKIEIDSFLVIQRDTNEIDSLVNLIKNNKTREIIREYVMRYVPIKDTVIHLTDGFTIKFWSKDGKINYTIDKEEEILEVPTETIIEKAKPIPLTFWEKAINATKRFYWWGIILVILYFIYRIGNFFVKRYFP